MTTKSSLPTNSSINALTSIPSTTLQNISKHTSKYKTKYISTNISSLVIHSEITEHDCFEKAIKRIEASHEKYLNDIVNVPEFFKLDKIKFYFLDWKNQSDPLWYNITMHPEREYCVGLWAVERFYLLSNHINRVYDLNDANVIIFGYDTGDELMNYPCYGLSLGTRLDFSHFTNYPDDIYITPRNKHRVVSFHDSMNSWLYNVIVDHIMKYHNDLPIFIYDSVSGEDPTYFNAFLNILRTGKSGIQNKNFNQSIIIGKFAFTDSEYSYRKNTDIQLAPPIMKSYYNETTLNHDVCTKAKYVYSFCGNLERKSSKTRLHFNAFWDRSLSRKYNNVRVVNTGEKGKNKCPDYDELMLNSTFLLIFDGDALWSYRFTEALLTYNILILLGMEHYIMPYENVIDYDEWYSNHGIIRVDNDVFLNMSSRLQFEEEIIPSLTEEQICNARLYNKKMVDLHFKNTISEVNTMLFSLQKRIS